MCRYFLSLFAILLASAVPPLSAAETTSLEDYLVGPVSHFLTPRGDFDSSDILVRTREPGEQSRVIKLSEKRGKVLMLTFWGPCQVCNRHLDQLQALQQKMGKDRLEVIAVNGGYNTPFDSIANALDRLGYTDITPVQARGRQLSHEMANRVAFEQSRGYPLTWIIDPKGEVRFLSDFAMNWSDIPEVMTLLEALADGNI